MLMNAGILLETAGVSSTSSTVVTSSIEQKTDMSTVQILRQFINKKKAKNIDQPFILV